MPRGVGTYVVSLSATDKDGGVGVTSQTITVVGGMPTVGISVAPDGVRGQTLVFTLTASDPDPANQAAGFTFDLTWGDGSKQTVTGASGLQVDHVFTASGTYTVQVTATDATGGVSAPASLAVMIEAVELQGTTLAVGGTTGNDVIRFFPAAHHGVKVVLNGVREGVYTNVREIVAYGQAGDDFISARDVKIPTMLFGGAGNDVLIGGHGPNVLVGGDGNDVLIGGSGRNILIGGGGSDLLIGGPRSDILIGGSTAWDTNDVALSALMAEWNSSHDYATRVANLSGTGTGASFANRLNGNYFLRTGSPGATVFDDGARDYLFSGGGHDWYLAFAGDWTWKTGRGHWSAHHHAAKHSSFQRVHRSD
jgi:Ca2+-binding RTX toxin-like protein